MEVFFYGIFFMDKILRNKKFSILIKKNQNSMNETRTERVDRN